MENTYEIITREVGEFSCPPVRRCIVVRDFEAAYSIAKQCLRLSENTREMGEVLSVKFLRHGI
jgi:hypothetical protein